MICEKYRGTFEKLIIEENHNTHRTQETIQKIYTFMDKYLKKERQKRIGDSFGQSVYDLKSPLKLHLTPTTKLGSRVSKNLDESSDRLKVRKGIERVNI